jgi:hypothetical protein
VQLFEFRYKSSYKSGSFAILKPQTSTLMNSKVLHINALLFILFIFSFYSSAQKVDRKKVVSHVAGAITLTNKGISTIPSFTLGKPAVTFDLSMGNGKLSFEPQFRFALEGRPWSFLFWWRYKLLESDKLNIGLGAHPALSFKTIPVISNGVSKDVIIARRYLAGELSPSYSVTKNISIGLYYLYSYCMEKDVASNNHFLSFRSNFSNIRLTDQYFMKVAPQFYYLKVGKEDGFYVNTTLTLAKSNFPLSISSVLNKTIESNVSGSKDFIWNISLVCTFSGKYAKL